MAGIGHFHSMHARVGPLDADETQAGAYYDPRPLHNRTGINDLAACAAEDRTRYGSTGISNPVARIKRPCTHAASEDLVGTFERLGINVKHRKSTAVRHGHNCLDVPHDRRDIRHDRRDIWTDPGDIRSGPIRKAGDAAMSRWVEHEENAAARRAHEENAAAQRMHFERGLYRSAEKRSMERLHSTSSLEIHLREMRKAEARRAIDEDVERHRKILKIW
jgi:hypothetical protein